MGAAAAGAFVLPSNIPFELARRIFCPRIGRGGLRVTNIQECIPVLDSCSVSVHLVSIDASDPVSCGSSLNGFRKLTWAHAAANRVQIEEQKPIRATAESKGRALSREDYG